MAFEPVDPVRHARLRVGHGLAMADLQAMGHVQIDCTEIAAAACDFPVAFMKDADTGQFRLTALLGLDGKRNLFVSDRGWHASYLPRVIARQPFAWARADDGALALAIDVDHPRTGDPEGLALFDAGGRESDFLKDRRRDLTDMIDDAQRTQDVISALTDHALIQPFPIELTDVDGHIERIDGLYTVSAARLATLADDAALALYHSGVLAHACGIVQSAGQFNRLQQLHAARAARDGAIKSLAAVVVGVPD